MTYATPLTKLPPHIAEKARTAALLGTRALIEAERFDALVAILVASGAVLAENARAMLNDLSAKLERRAVDGDTEWQTVPAELKLESERLRWQAERIALP